MLHLGPWIIPVSRAKGSKIIKKKYVIIWWVLGVKISRLFLVSRNQKRPVPRDAALTARLRGILTRAWP